MLTLNHLGGGQGTITNARHQNFLEQIDAISSRNPSVLGTITNIENSVALANIMQQDLGKNGSVYRAARLLGFLTKENHKIKANIPSQDRSQFSQERYKFFLDAPFEISSECCKVMKKKPIHEYTKRTRRKFITAQMASESRLRTQQWIKNGCNGFDMKNPISNPLSFWVEQDILLYIRENNIPICSVYGDVVTEDEATGQGNLSDYGIFDLERPCLHTTGCQRTGCVGCGYGLHLDKGENRFDMLSKTHPKLFDFFMRGGKFNEKGLWKPGNGGMGYWFVIQWINIYGGFDIHIENYEYYEEKYGTEETKKYLYGNDGNQIKHIANLDDM